MGTCDTCRWRTGWRAAYSRFGPSTAVADCMSEPWPEWWKALGEHPIVMPGAGSACQRYEVRPATMSAGMPEARLEASDSQQQRATGSTE